MKLYELLAQSPKVISKGKGVVEIDLERGVIYGLDPVFGAWSDSYPNSDHHAFVLMPHEVFNDDDWYKVE